MTCLPRLAVVAIAAVLVGQLGAASADAATIRVQGTTDTVDSGLVDLLLKPGYRKAQPGDMLQYVGVGTGKALDNARAGLADLVITHAPSLERKFVAQGWSLESAGIPLFHSDYVIVGPKSDPAGVAGGAPHDAVAAFERIAAAGAAGRAVFVSRGDDSGTDVKEQLLWGMTGAGVAKAVATNADGDAQRFEPGAKTGAYPAWYRRTGKGQAANLLEASACNSGAATAGCYTILDRGTFERQVQLGLVPNMKIVTRGNSSSAPGGAGLLVNRFNAYVVNPAKVEGVDVAGAKRVVAYLTSKQFQMQLLSFPTAADPAFLPDAKGTAAASAGQATSPKDADPDSGVPTWCFAAGATALVALGLGLIAWRRRGRA